MINIIELNRMVECLNTKDYALLEDYLSLTDMDKFKSYMPDDFKFKVTCNNFGLNVGADLFMIKAEIENFINTIKKYHQHLSSKLTISNNKNKLQSTILKSIEHLNKIKSIADTINEDNNKYQIVEKLSEIVKLGYKIVILYASYEGVLNKIKKVNVVDYTKLLDISSSVMVADLAYEKLFNDYKESNGILTMFNKFLDLVIEDKNPSENKLFLSYLNKINYFVSDISNISKCIK